jgi:acyl-CoA thioesterase I
VAIPPLLPAHPPRAERTEVVFLGDSLTAGYGVAEGAAYPALLQAAWRRRGLPWRAVNEGISGDTTEDVLARLHASRGPGAELTIVEIGANDAFHAVPVPEIEKNLAAILRVLARGGSRVALSPVEFLDSFLPAGDEYTAEFNGLFARVGSAESVPVLPPLLRGLVQDARLWQADGVHPTAQGQAVIARDLLADLNPEWSDRA